MSNQDHIRPIDQAVLELLRRYSGLSVQKMTEQLQVTATAVRQRLERLVEMDLVAREKVSVGRGRPQYRYSLTAMGTRYAGASYADLASALWDEVRSMPNPHQRARILRKVAKKMGAGLKNAIPVCGNIAEKLDATVSELNRRKVAAEVDESGELPILEVHSCPYPELAEGDETRQLCEIEQEMISEAIGHSVQLDCCRLDGHDSCQFRPVVAPDEPPN